jgi:hypothetical protein
LYLLCICIDFSSPKFSFRTITRTLCLSTKSSHPVLSILKIKNLGILNIIWLSFSNHLNSFIWLWISKLFTFWRIKIDYHTHQW